jgi:dipeptidyl aminopeptidase/acylaminoacyl peptidase
VNVRAFANHGELAFVSRGKLWLLDGARGSLRRLLLPAGLSAETPRFSHDGRWLAYLVTRGSGLYAARVGLWLARTDGTRAHRVAGRNIAQFVGWSPTSDLLALTTQREEPFPPYPTVAHLELVSANGSHRALVDLRPTRAHPDSIEDAVWSPDGRSIAVSTNDLFLDGGTLIRSYPIDGGAPTTWFRIATRQRLANACTGCGGQGVLADLAAWSARYGILFWVYSSGMTHNNDATPLEVVPRPGIAPSVLAQTLSDGVTDALATGTRGALAVVSAGDGGRELAQSKTVEHCNPTTLSCTPVPGATAWAGKNGSGVSLDPAWSPSGSLLAYVRAPVVLMFRGSPPATWFADHVLYVWNAQTDSTRRMGAISGAQVPVWSHDGKQLLYVGNDGLWLVSAEGGKPVEIAYPLFRVTGLYTSGTDDYFDQSPWRGQFSWSSP